VKLAAMLGCLLGATVVSALALGIVTAGLVSLGLVATKRATLHSTIAYGPYLAFGGAVAILAFNHPSLV
jgi:leader peptidase (prepilin peptidase) / N-methyltransferase